MATVLCLWRVDDFDAWAPTSGSCTTAIADRRYTSFDYTRVIDVVSKASARRIISRSPRASSGDQRKLRAGAQDVRARRRTRGERPGLPSVQPREHRGGTHRGPDRQPVQRAREHPIADAGDRLCPRERASSQQSHQPEPGQRASRERKHLPDARHAMRAQQQRPRAPDRHRVPVRRCAGGDRGCQRHAQRGPRGGRSVPHTDGGTVPGAPGAVALRRIGGAWI